MNDSKFYIGATVRLNSGTALWKASGKIATIIGRDLNEYPSGEVWKIEFEDGFRAHEENNWHETYFDLMMRPVQIEMLL